MSSYLNLYVKPKSEFNCDRKLLLYSLCRCTPLYEALSQYVHSNEEGTLLTVAICDDAIHTLNQSIEEHKEKDETFMEVMTNSIIKDSDTLYEVMEEHLSSKRYIKSLEEQLRLVAWLRSFVNDVYEGYTDFTEVRMTIDY